MTSLPSAAQEAASAFGTDPGPVIRVATATNSAVLLREPGRGPYPANPFVTIRTNVYGRAIRDHHLPSGNPAPRPAPPAIELNEEGAVGHGSRHSVHFKANLAEEDAISVVLPTGRMLRGQVVALALSDAKGNRQWLGQVKDCRGEWIQDRPSQIIYRDAFDGIRADVLYLHDYNTLEQDVILRERPAPAPEIDPTTAVLEVWSEFTEPPLTRTSVSQISLRRGDPASGAPAMLADDITLDFAGMRMTAGKAFRLAEDRDAERRTVIDVPVAKQWIEEDGRFLLVESVDYLSLREDLATLAPHTPGFRNPGTKRQMAAQERLPKRPEPSGLLATTLGTDRWSASLAAEPGVVLDYILVTGTLLNINFGTVTRPHGPAAIGTGGPDFWNTCGTPGQFYGMIQNLRYAELSEPPSDIDIELENLPGVWGNQTGDMMMDSYIYPWSMWESAIARLSSIPPGTYDFLIYGAWGGTGAVNGKYHLSVAGQQHPDGIKTTVLGPSWASLSWTEGEHYVAFRDVFVGAGQTVEIVAMPGDNVALFNGLQMLATASQNQPPSISAIADQSIGIGSTCGPLSFQISDAETPPGSLSLQVSSSNPSLIPLQNIVLGGSGEARNITLTPVSGQEGVTTITVTVTDLNAGAASETFLVSVHSAAESYVEISKAGWVLDASSEFSGSWVAENAADGSVADPGWRSAGTLTSGNWLRVNLGQPYPVGRIQYCSPQGIPGIEGVPNSFEGTFLHYRIYVTNNSTNDAAAWGYPVIDDVWDWETTDQAVKTVSFPHRWGQYVIFQCLEGYPSANLAAVNEVWVHAMAGLDFSGKSFNTRADDDGTSLPFAIPGIVQMEEYNYGGQGVAVHDMTVANDLDKFRPAPLDTLESPNYPETLRNSANGAGYSLRLGPGEYTTYQIEVAPNQVDYVHDVYLKVYSGTALSGTHTRISFFRNNVELPGSRIFATGTSTSWVTRKAGAVTFPGPGIYQMRITSEAASTDITYDYALLTKPPVVAEVSENPIEYVTSLGENYKLIPNDPTKAAQNGTRLTAYLQGQTGKRLFFPEGTYYFRQPDDITTEIQSEGQNHKAVDVEECDTLEFIGEGADKTFLVADNRATVLFRFVNCANITFRDMAFQGVPHRRLAGLQGTETFPSSVWNHSTPMPLPGLVDNTSVGEALCFFSAGPMSYESGTPLQDIVIEDCAFINMPTRGVFLQAARGARIQNCVFTYFANNAACTYEWSAETASVLQAHVGVMATGNPNSWNENLQIVGNTFIGNSQWRIQSGRPTTGDYAADGLVWIQAGGNFLIQSNLVQDYHLEGVHLGAGPAIVTENRFETETLGNKAVALQAHDAGTYRRETGILTYIASFHPTFYFSNNEVEGGWLGVISAPNSDLNDYSWPYTLSATGNTIELAVPDPYPYDNPPIAFNLVSAENALIAGNVILEAGRGIQAGLHYVAMKDVARLNLKVRCNDMMEIRDRTLFVSNPVGYGNVLFDIHGSFVANRIGRGSTRQHLLIEGPDPLEGRITIRGAELYSKSGGAALLENPQVLQKSWGSAGVADDTGEFEDGDTFILY